MGKLVNATQERGSRVNLCQDLLSSQGEELSPGAASSVVKEPLAFK